MPAKICRVCFEVGSDHRELGVGPTSTGSKLSACVPEINIYIVENPTICRPCLCMVEVAYKLRETCLENEKRFNQNFDRNDFVFSKKVHQIKKENTTDKDQHEKHQVGMVFNDSYESGVLNIDANHILKTEETQDFSQTPFENNDEMPIDVVPQIKTEVFDPGENLLEVSEEYITTESNESFISRMNAEGVSEYSCNLCNRSFSGMKYLKIHLNRIHYKNGDKNAKFECELCFKVFTTKSGLAIHSKSCKNLKKLKNKYNMNNIELSESNSGTSRPSNSNSPGQNDTFTCEKCLKIFTTRASFRAHSKHCSEEFLDETELNIDSINPLMMAAKVVTADPIASKTNEDAVDSNSDEVDSDYNPDSPDVDSDGSDFPINSRRKRKFKGRSSWVMTSTEPYKRKYIDLQIQCDNCARTFTTRAAFSNHSKSCLVNKQLLEGISKAKDTSEGENVEKSEEGDVEHVCKICEEKCSSQKSLEEHVSKHIDMSVTASGSNQAKSAGCEITVCCGNEYTTVSLLQLHTYKEHGKSCGVCNKHFTSYNELFAHLLEHTKS